MDLQNFYRTTRRHIPNDRILYYLCLKGIVKAKAVPVTSRGGPWGCTTSRLLHFLNNLFIDGGEVVSLMCLPPPFNPRNIPGTQFC
jgi:hypothetical protein